MVRIGIIGCGKIAERHIFAYKHLHDLEIVISDINPNYAKALGERHRIQYTSNPKNLIKSKEIDIIDICTPTIYHKDQILASLRAKKHVFCEKPLCMNSKEAYEIKEAREKANRILMVGYLYRFYPAFTKLKQILNEGILGKPYYAIFRIGSRGEHRFWKHMKGEGGGAIYETMVHNLDLINWYFGKCNRVKVLSSSTVLPYRTINGRTVSTDADDCTLVEFDMNGVKVFCHSDLISPGYMNYVEIHAENGSVFTSILYHLPTILFLKEQRGIYNQGNNFFTFEQTNTIQLELTHFLEAVKKKGKYLNSIDDSIKVMEIIDKIREQL